MDELKRREEKRLDASEETGNTLIVRSDHEDQRRLELALKSAKTVGKGVKMLGTGIGQTYGLVGKAHSYLLLFGLGMALLTSVLKFLAAYTHPAVAYTAFPLLFIAVLAFSVWKLRAKDGFFRAIKNIMLATLYVAVPIMLVLVPLRILTMSPQEKQSFIASISKDEANEKQRPVERKKRGAFRTVKRHP